MFGSGVIFLATLSTMATYKQKSICFDSHRFNGYFRGITRQTPLMNAVLMKRSLTVCSVLSRNKHVLIGDTRFRTDGKYAVYAKWIEEN